jgi:hypothetical protein
MANARNSSKKQPGRWEQRLPLPGQDPRREAELLAKYTEYFKPDTLEEMWVEDIASTIAGTEFNRAVIAGYLAACVRELCAAEFAEQDEFWDRPGQLGGNTGKFSEEERRVLRMYSAMEFSPRPGHSYLDQTEFGCLLGLLSCEQVQHLNLLQANLHREQKERDRYCQTNQHSG